VTGVLQKDDKPEKSGELVTAENDAAL